MVAIDVHAHVGVPDADRRIAGEPGFVAQLQEDAVTAGAASTAVNREQIARLAPALTDVTARLAAMDAAGVDVQVVSATPVPRHWLPLELAAEYARAVNDSVAAQCAQASDRLLAAAYAPLHLPELAVAELRHAVQELGATAVQISTSAGPGRELDDASLEPFWAAAEDLDIAVLIHPWGCTLGARLDVGYMFNHVGNPTETSVALSRLIFGGVLDRHPGLRVWAAHGGGWLPAYSGRADHAWERRSDARTCARRPSEYLREIWVDALVYQPHALRHLVEAVGADHITIGSDYPFDMGVEDPIGLLRAADLPRDTIETITDRSAAALLGRHLPDAMRSRS